MKSIEESAAAAAARSTADDVKMLVVVQLLQMNYHSLDQQKAFGFVDKWLKQNGLSNR